MSNKIKIAGDENEYDNDEYDGQGEYDENDNRGKNKDGYDANDNRDDDHYEDDQPAQPVLIRSNGHIEMPSKHIQSTPMKSIGRTDNQRNNTQYIRDSDEEEDDEEEKYEYRYEKEIYEEDEDEEDEYDKNYNDGTSSIYLDGLAGDDYRKLDGRERKFFTQSDCCQRYFEAEAFIHKTLYNLEIPGINTCIHCYISFNPQKFFENKTNDFDKDLSVGEKECLKYYIENFSKNHDQTKCTRILSGLKCLLCEARLGIKHHICKTNDDFEVIETIINNGRTCDATNSYTFSDSSNNFVISDIMVINNGKNDFVLEL